MVAKYRQSGSPWHCLWRNCLPSTGYNQIQSSFTNWECQLVYCLHWNTVGLNTHGGHGCTWRSRLHMKLCWVHEDHSLAWAVLQSDCSCLVSRDSQGYFLARSSTERHWRRNKCLSISFIFTETFLKVRTEVTLLQPALTLTHRKNSVLLPLGVGR